MPDKLWTIEQVMEYAGIKSRSTVYALMRKGLKSIKAGGLHFHPDTVKQFFLELEA